MISLTTPFNLDERAAQVLSGYGALDGAPIRDEMSDQHRTFFEGLPYLFVGALEDEGAPLATILTGAPGFVRSPDPQTLVIRALPAATDPTTPGIAVGNDIALLGIDLATRRRNRANGMVVAKDDDSFTIQVEQSFGNCPKYIQRRSVEAATRAPGQLEESHGLDDAARALIRNADTFLSPAGRARTCRRLRASTFLTVEGSRASCRSPPTTVSSCPTIGATVISTPWETSWAIRAPHCCSWISNGVICYNSRAW